MKKFVIICMFVLAALCTASCGRISEINSSELTELLNSSSVFSERLTEIDDTAAEKRFFLNPSDYTDMTAYVGTKAVCDEFAIIKTSDPDTVMTKLRGHLDIQKNNYSSYRPAEAQKIDSALLTEYKGTVVLVVSGSSENVVQLYENYLKK